MHSCIATCSTINRKDLYDITNITKQDFSVINNIPYEFAVFEQTNLQPAWNKLDYVIALLNSYDSVLWLDDDAGFLKFDNIFTELQTIEFFGIAETFEGLNSGVFYITKAAIDYLFAAKLLYDKYKNNSLYEQPAILEAIQSKSYTILNGAKYNATIFESVSNYVTTDTSILHLAGYIFKQPIKKDFIARLFKLY